MSPFTVASYNVLADAYIRRDRYRHVRAEDLDPARRWDRLARHITALDADIVCLQEVEAPLFARIAKQQRAVGYAGEYAQKAGARPDGCATFIRLARFARPEFRTLYFDDGSPASGHVAQLTTLAWNDRPLIIANTHLRWDPPDWRGRDHIGVRQAAELADWLQAQATEAIVCGDLNATAGSDVLREFLSRGFTDAYAGWDTAHTCNANARASRIDFLLFTHGLVAQPIALPPIDASTPLPSAHQPSDHLAIAAHFAVSPPSSPAPRRR